MSTFCPKPVGLKPLQDSENTVPYVALNDFQVPKIQVTYFLKAKYDSDESNRISFKIEVENKNKNYTFEYVKIYVTYDDDLSSFECELEDKKGNLIEDGSEIANFVNLEPGSKKKRTVWGSMERTYSPNQQQDGDFTVRFGVGFAVDAKSYLQDYKVDVLELPTP
ncbi:MAG: hypothetical protein F6J86_27160 [Symploca sp. SIO1B1]|nr:hypothetical protein [Symploca sp. SIO1B1]